MNNNFSWLWQELEANKQQRTTTMQAVSFVEVGIMAVEEARVMLTASGCIQTILDREHRVFVLQRTINNCLYARAHSRSEVDIGFVMNVRPSVCSGYRVSLPRGKAAGV
jgi:hypothetical protein